VRSAFDRAVRDIPCCSTRDFLPLRGRFNAPFLQCWTATAGAARNPLKNLESLTLSPQKQARAYTKNGNNCGLSALQ
jgi:hypothetical protein